MTVSMAVRSGRRAAEKLMVDNCRITRTGEPTIGPDGREHISETTVYEDKVTVTGREFRVAGLHEKTYQTAIRLLVDEVVI